jgi:hypothetical protein
MLCKGPLASPASRSEAASHRCRHEPNRTPSTAQLTLVFLLGVSRAGPQGKKGEPLPGLGSSAARPLTQGESAAFAALTETQP